MDSSRLVSQIYIAIHKQATLPVILSLHLLILEKVSLQAWDETRLGF